MKTYYIDSIEQKFCFKTKLSILNEIQKCLKCNKIPLPSHRAVNSPKNFYCKSYYYFLKMNPELLICPSEHEIDLLDNLVISCKNFNNGCNNEYKTINLQEKFQHENDCDYSDPSNFLNQKRSMNFSQIIQNDEKFTEEKIKKTIHDELQITFNSLINQNQEFQNKFKSLQEIIINQNNNYDRLKNTVQLLEKGNRKLEERIENNAIIIQKQFNRYYDRIRKKHDSDKDIQNNSINYERNSITLKGHNGAVNSLAQIDDYTLASCSFDQMIKIWDLKTFRCKFTLHGHQNSILCIIRVNENKIASGLSDMNIKIWDLNFKQCIVTLKGHENYVSSIVLLNTGKLPSGSFDKNIRIWDWITQECIFSLSGHNRYITSIIELKDLRLASASQDNTIKLCDLNNKQCTNTIY